MDTVSFNRIAPLYDVLSKMVFGNALWRAKNCFIHKLPNDGSILFIGGGSGLELKKIALLKPALKIDFIEPSDKFISIAKKKASPDTLHNTCFIHGNQDSIVSDRQYAAIITFFVIDIFPQKEAEEFCTKIIFHLQPDGILLFADFIPTKKIVQKLLLNVMYRFFKIVANISATHLPDYNLIFQKIYMKAEATQFFYGGMVSSQVLRKLR